MRRYEESLAITRRLGNEAGIAATLNNIGLIHDRQGRYDNAMRRYEESLIYLLPLSISKTCSGVMGISVIRAPMASLTAFVTAPGEALQGGSPMPRAPWGPIPSPDSVTIVSHAPRSSEVGIR
jgi:hypothetical protein